jgi:bacterial/archaeal transporter family-2 protein
VAFAVALAAVAGLAGAVQAAVMGELGERVGIWPAVAFSGLVTIALAFGALAFADGIGSVARVVREPVWLWTGGALSVLIVLAVTVGAPRIGVTATIGTVIAGNLLMAAVIDQFGMFGLDKIAITWPRALGLVFLATGTALSLHKG